MIALIVITVLISMVLVIIFALSSETVYDRILAANSFGTKTVALIALISIVYENSMFIDVALVYALVNFITTIALMKYFKYDSLGKE